jgi:hypothetical protein
MFLGTLIPLLITRPGLDRVEAGNRPTGTLSSPSGLFATTLESYSQDGATPQELETGASTGSLEVAVAGNSPLREPAGQFTPSSMGKVGAATSEFTSGAPQKAGPARNGSSTPVPGTDPQGPPFKDPLRRPYTSALRLVGIPEPSYPPQAAPQELAAFGPPGAGLPESPQVSPCSDVIEASPPDSIGPLSPSIAPRSKLGTMARASFPRLSQPFPKEPPGSDASGTIVSSSRPGTPVDSDAIRGSGETTSLLERVPKAGAGSVSNSGSLPISLAYLRTFGPLNDPAPSSPQVEPGYGSQANVSLALAAGTPPQPADGSLNPGLGPVSDADPTVKPARQENRLDATGSHSQLGDPALGRVFDAGTLGSFELSLARWGRFATSNYGRGSEAPLTHPASSPSQPEQRTQPHVPGAQPPGGEPPVTERRPLPGTATNAEEWMSQRGPKRHCHEIPVASAGSFDGQGQPNGAVSTCPAVQPGLAQQLLPESGLPYTASWDSVSRQLEAIITQTYREQRHVVRLRLHPPELGELEIQLSEEAAGVSVRFVATQGEVAQAIAQQSSTLVEALRQAGLPLIRLEVNVGEQNGGSQQGGWVDRDLIAAEWEGLRRRTALAQQAHRLGEVPLETIWSSGGLDVRV